MSKTEKPETRAIMFSDIVGSSALYIQKGNAQAQALIENMLGKMTAQVEAHQGVVIKTIGDEIMASFTDANKACHCAISMNEHLTQYAINIRTGVAFGTVVLTHDKTGANDVFGDTVNHAAFLAKLAQARQVIINDDLKKACEPSLLERCEPFDNVALKGKKETETVYRISWEVRTEDSLDATIMATNTSLAKLTNKTRLYLCTPEKTIIVNKSDGPVVCGRDPSVTTICLNSEKTSRQHCSFYFSRGKFVIEDHSSNGTFLIPSINSEDETIYIRRETTPLPLSGSIVMGQEQPEKGSQIRFEIHLNALD